MLEWWDHVRPKLSVEQMPIEAIQEPGDIMYVPEGWHHAVINIDDVVGISYQSMCAEPARTLWGCARAVALSCFCLTLIHDNPLKNARELRLSTIIPLPCADGVRRRVQGLREMGRAESVRDVQRWRRQPARRPVCPHALQSK